MRVENSVAELKTCKAIGSLWRNPIHTMADAVFICAAASCVDENKLMLYCNAGIVWYYTDML